MFTSDVTKSGQEPHGGHDRSFGGAQHGGDRQVRCARLEDQRERPPGLRYGRHRGGGQRQGMGPEHSVVAGLRVTVSHPPEGVRVGWAVVPAQDDVVGRGHAWEPVPRHARRPLLRGLDWLAGAPVPAVRRSAEEARRRDGASSPGHEAPRGSLPPTGAGAGAPLAGGQPHQGRQVAGVIPAGMPREGALGRAETRPGEPGQARRARRAVHGKARVLAAQAGARGPRLAAGVPGGPEAGVEGGGPSRVGRGARGAWGRAHAEGGERFGGGRQRGLPIPPTGASSPWGDDQGPDRAPPG